MRGSRRSTDRQEQSIEDQKNAISAYVAENGLRFLRFYIDDAISGTSTLGRRAFQQMFKDAESSPRPFDIIAVYDIKRFGRLDNDEAGYYRYLLRTHGIEVRYVSENFNGDTTDDLLRPVKQWQARQESKDLSKVTIRGLLSKSGSGFWMGGTPPYGYDLRYENADSKFLLILRYMPDGSKKVLNKQGKVIRTLARGESLVAKAAETAFHQPGEYEPAALTVPGLTMVLSPRVMSPLFNRGGLSFTSLSCLLQQSEAYKRWMSITNDNPVLFLIGHQPGPMYVLAVYSLSLTNPVEPTICATVPHHISGVERIDQNGSDGGIGPLATVNV